MTPNKPLIMVVHGYRVKNPAKSVGKIFPMFEGLGIEVVDFTYGYVDLIQQRFGSKAVAHSFLSMCRLAYKYGYYVVPVGHSNGANIINQAAWLASQDYWSPNRPIPFTHSVYLSPALDRDMPMAPGMKYTDVFHTRADSAVKLARLRWFSPWGDMGACGYVGRDARYRNFDAFPYVKGHSDWFTEAGLAYLRAHLVQRLQKEFEKCGLLLSSSPPVSSEAAASLLHSPGMAPTSTKASRPPDNPAA